MTTLLLALVLSLQAATQLGTEDEARAQDLMREVRCMVCAGQSIADSDAGMALHMRRFVRERVAEGQSDRASREALVERFGYQVLMRPPLDSQTAPLWIAPVAFLLLGGGLLAATMRKKKR